MMTGPLYSSLIKNTDRGLNVKVQIKRQNNIQTHESDLHALLQKFVFSSYFTKGWHPSPNLQRQCQRSFFGGWLWVFFCILFWEKLKP